MDIKPVKTAIIGCGNISSIYIENAKKWDVLDLVACANRTLPRAQSQAEKFGVPKARLAISPVDRTQVRAPLDSLIAPSSPPPGDLR